MARKNLLLGLTGAGLPAGNSAPETPAEAPVAVANFGGARGAIGAVTRSIEQLKAQAVVEIAAELIDASFISDRLEFSADSQAELVQSMRAHGQQVPILVRPHPEGQGRYQIAYGRRRLRAAAELGRPVRAVVKPLTDDQLVVAQGQENSARTDLSFIEKAMFAHQLEERGFSRETIMAALSVDKTGLSRLISSVVKIPHEIIAAIGPAPKAGRDRWGELATRLEQAAVMREARKIVAAENFSAVGSDERFVLVFEAAASRPAPKAPPVEWTAEDGAKVARIKTTARNVSLVIDEKAAPEFGAYLIEALPELYAAFKRRADA